MHAPPHDPTVVERMRTAHRHAQCVLGVSADHPVWEAWGWRGRTLSQPVSLPFDGPVWLRLACAHAIEIDEVRTFWDGSLHAEHAIPATVPRPQLRQSHDFTHGQWHYRAELYDRVPTHTIAASPTLTRHPALPRSWWNALRRALTDVATVPTVRCTIPGGQRYLDWAMPHALGEPITTTASSWTTAHGDLHWANLCGPTLHILDWEGWGLAPPGYDAAMLHSYSLLIPRVAARIRTELAEALLTPDGRFAELAVVAELLHNNAYVGHRSWIDALRSRASHLLGRAVPSSSTEQQRATP